MPYFISWIRLELETRRMYFKADQPCLLFLTICSSQMRISNFISNLMWTDLIIKFATLHRHIFFYGIACFFSSQKKWTMFAFMNKNVLDKTCVWISRHKLINVINQINQLVYDLKTSKKNIYFGPMKKYFFFSCDTCENRSFVWLSLLRHYLDFSRIWLFFWPSNKYSAFKPRTLWIERIYLTRWAYL